MVETKTKTATARAKIAHKLARYYRATPIHLTGTQGQSQPSTSHLSIPIFTQPSAEPPRGDSETKTTPGTQPMTRQLFSREPQTNPDPLQAENPSSLDQSSSYSQASAGEEESSSLKPSPLETF
jgi:hypothetical protein